MRSEKINNRINDILETAMKNLGGLIDVNTVVGSPIKTEDGDVVIPISKVTFGVLSGGGEYGKLNIFQKNSELPYSAGNGAIVSVKPCGFLLKRSGAEYKVLPVSNDAVSGVLDKTVDFISSLGDKQ